MKTIQILGPGCARCKRLEQATAKAASELGIEHQIEKVTDVMRFADFGVMMTPALVVDGEVKVSGRVPSHDELTQMLR
jgi:small redox-active disulfide protein 2